MQPMITIYRPVRDGNRWLARADVVARGELTELQATASNKLAKRAEGWVNQAAQWVSQWIQYADGPPQRLGVGAFGDLPIVATEVAKAITALPGRQPVMQAADILLTQANNGNEIAIAEIAKVRENAKASQSAGEMYEALCCMHDAMTGWDPSGFSIGPVIAGAAAGDPAALSSFAAMRSISPVMPARIQYSVDEYCACGDGCEQMAGDAIGASLYELVSPRRRATHRMVPGRYRAAIEALRGINRIPPSIRPN